MTFAEKYAGASLASLRARLEALSHDVDLLTKFWNDYQAGNEYYSTVVPVQDPEFWKNIPLAPWEPGQEDPDVKKTDWVKVIDFIHNFCTNLCAEKIFVKDLLNRQAQPYLTSPRN